MKEQRLRKENTKKTAKRTDREASHNIRNKKGERTKERMKRGKERRK